MTTVQIQLPPKLIPIFAGKARYRCAYGGRGSAKTRSFAKMAAVRGYQIAQAGESGIIVCAREFMNSLDDSSMAEVKAAIASEPWLAAQYDVGERYIRTKDGRISFGFTGLRHNLESIKSKAKIHILWVDEAEPVTEESWQVVVPTVREHDSEIWVTWNPKSRQSATHKRFREQTPGDCRITEINWRDNPWFPDVLDLERREDLEKRPEYYPHIWEGEFATVVEGAYYSKCLIEAEQQGRISHVAADPLLPIRLFADIGGTGARSDHFVFIAAQFVGMKIPVIDHYEAQGQPAASHLQWLRERGYTPGVAEIVLPHDGDSQDKVFDVSYRSFFEDAGYRVTVIPNQGRGAAKMRVEAARRLFPRIWFNKDSTVGLRESLGAYHEKIDPHRQIGLGPEHDWSSHSADAFGLMCVAYEEPRDKIKHPVHRPLPIPGGWMA